MLREHTLQRDRVLVDSHRRDEGAKNHERGEQGSPYRQNQKVMCRDSNAQKEDSNNEVIPPIQPIRSVDFPLRGSKRKSVHGSLGQSGPKSLRRFVSHFGQVLRSPVIGNWLFGLRNIGS